MCLTGCADGQATDEAEHRSDSRAEVGNGARIHPLQGFELNYVLNFLQGRTTDAAPEVFG